MTLEALHKLPIGTPVVWNRKNVDHGHRGKVAVTPGGQRFIQWDDGTSLYKEDRSWRAVRNLRNVKRLPKETA